MRRLLPQNLPVWGLLIVIAGLVITQVTTLYNGSRDRAAANDVVDLYRLNDRAYSLVQLMHDDTPEQRKLTASGLFNATYALTVSDTPAVTSSIAGDDELAELEDILVGRLSKFGITDARVRRDPATQAANAPGGVAVTKDVGAVERDLLSLAASFAQSDKLTASVRFADGQWLNFTEPNTPVGPIL